MSHSAFFSDAYTKTHSILLQILGRSFPQPQPSRLSELAGSVLAAGSQGGDMNVP